MELPTDSPKLKNWIVHPRRNLSRWLMQQRVANREFTIISNDCWGAQVYQELDLPYRTPFVGTFLMAPCYLKLLQDLPGYLRSPLHFTPKSRYEFTDCDYLLKRSERHAYPIGLLKDDVEVHFVHYASEQEARKKWNRRLQRTLWDQGQLLIKFSNDRILCREEDIVQFDALPFSHKVCFTHKPYPHLPSAVWVKDYTKNGVTMYQRCKKYFDLPGWLDRGQPAAPAAVAYKSFNSLLYWRY